jgi:hypothetical protein
VPKLHLLKFQIFILVKTELRRKRYLLSMIRTSPGQPVVENRFNVVIFGPFPLTLGISEG